MSESAPLAIIGISCLFPKADDLQAYWRNIKNGVDAITSVPEDSHWKSADYFNADPKAPDQTYARRGGFISAVDFNPMDFGIAPKDVEATDTTQLLGLMAARQALIDAGYESKPFPRERTSVILGVTGALELVIPLGARLGHPIWRRALKESGVADPVADDVVRRISDSYVGWQENSFPGLLGNVAAGRIASRLDLGGTNCVVDAACASSMAALHLAALELASGRSDMVVTGGLDTFNDIFMYMCFSKTPALSPSGDAKPFDRSCDGTILGEGLGMLVLKRLADAERDGDRVYAVLKGIGSSSDGRGNAIYAPRAEGQREALNRAYASAGAGPETIELIEAHGTGTKVGDATELQALSEVYRAAGRQGTWTALGSVKSQIGHTKAAAGVAGLIKAAMALHHKILPPTIKVTQPVDEAAPGRSPFYVNTAKRPWLPRTNHPRRAGVSAFGFGGTNFHCVLEEHSARRTKPGWDGDVEILALSALTREEIATQVRALPASPPWPELRERARRSRAAFDPAAPFRLLLPIVRGSALAALRDSALAMLDKQPAQARWVLPSGAAFGSGPCRGKLAALFPGQGAQYPGMLRDLACQFPAMIDSLELADRVFAAERPQAGDPAPERLDLPASRFFGRNTPATGGSAQVHRHCPAGFGGRRPRSVECSGRVRDRARSRRGPQLRRTGRPVLRGPAPARSLAPPFQRARPAHGRRRQRPRRHARCASLRGRGRPVRSRRTTPAGHRQPQFPHPVRPGRPARSHRRRRPSLGQTLRARPGAARFGGVPQPDGGLGPSPVCSHPQRRDV